MKYVALVSGGKDSCYNLLHCQKHGHELVAAASLGPKDGQEEADSYMYQTVGQDAIDLIAEALDVPLYRSTISGDALQQNLAYGERLTQAGVAGDETEDMYRLLSEVKTHHPDIQGVSVGAILSSYQRIRVEHVCQRLGLTSLAYLWQRDQSELLSEMVSSGLTAILIKVAGIGLTTKHLGQTLGDMQPTLEKLNRQYGSHVCGEGGEYETFTIDSPMFKKRIVIKELETVIHSDHDFAVVAYLRIKEAILQDKQPADFDLTIPPLLEEKFHDILDTLRVTQYSQRLTASSYITPAADPVDRDLGPSCLNVGSWVSVGNIAHTRSSGEERPLSLEDETLKCFELLQEQLRQQGLDLSHVSNINVSLRSMEDFASFNTVYSRQFGTSPPARACVSVDLPTSVRVRLDCVANRDVLPSARQALHVQGLSYWAPANIGPYSQAILVDDRIFVSGQIGLEPPTLTLPSPSSLPMELTLSAQHADRIMTVVGSSSGGRWSGAIQGTIYWVENTEIIPPVQTAESLYEPVPSYPVLVAAVKALPKGALVEKQVLAHSGCCSVTDEDGEVSIQSCVPIFTTDSLKVDGQVAILWEISRFAESGAFCAVIFLKDQDIFERLDELKARAPSLFKGAISVRAFSDVAATAAAPLICHQFVHGAQGVTVVPCRTIRSRTSSIDWRWAVWVMGTN